MGTEPETGAYSMSDDRTSKQASYHHHLRWKCFTAPWSCSYGIWIWKLFVSVARNSKDFGSGHSRVSEELFFPWYEVSFLPATGFYVALLLMNTKCGSIR